MNCANDYFKFLCKWVLENCSEDMKFVSKRIDKTSIDRLESMISSSYEKISYMEAVDILKKVHYMSLVLPANMLYLASLPHKSS